MKKILFFTFITFNIMAEPCNVELFSKIYRFESKQNLNQKEVIKNSTCSEAINSQLVQLISKKDGEQFVAILERENNEQLHITPRKIALLDLSTLLRDQLTANSNLYFLDNKSLNNLRSISLSEDESIKIQCDSCTTLGEKNIKIEISNPINNSVKALWISSKIFAKVKVIKAKHTIGFQQKSLASDDFYTEESFTIMPDNLLGSLENIHFYKPNRTILQGMTITNMDIQPVNLVNYGTPVKAILKSQTIGLSKMAIPVRSAQFGETVELKVGNNKTISGKVIDYNQVVIEL